MSLRETIRWDGTIGRMPYAVLGLVGGGLKWHLDRWLPPGNTFYSWLEPKNTFWGPFFTEAAELPLLDDEYLLYWLISTVAFLIGAFVLTRQRLRDIGVSQLFSLGLLLPWGNLLLFGALSVIPGRAERSEAGNRWVARDRWGSAVTVTAAAAGVAVVLTGFGATLLGGYGWSLFVGTPFVLGFLSTSLFVRGRETSALGVLAVTSASIVCAGAALLACAIEGVICLVMAAPLAFPLAWLGGAVAYAISRARRDHGQVAAAAILVLPAVMSFENRVLPPPPVFEVTTAVEVDATPAEVWPHVIELAELPEPKDWLFRFGIAYPIRTEIEGAGVGGKRRCVFSTGVFVEPIEAWEEARLLQFSVVSTPPSMREWTPYEEIHAPHLEGFMVSSGGRFLLTELPGGRTRLEGTSWYRHGLWPSGYWRIISDEIAHKIHLRVLDNIRERSETIPTARLQ